MTEQKLVDGELFDFTAEEQTAFEAARVAAALDALASRRWQAEIGGITVPQVPTDHTTRATLTAAYVKAKENPAYTVRWKAGPGVFVTLDADTIIAMADAVAAHVQACFDREDELSAAILAAEDPASVDINTGWPA